MKNAIISVVPGSVMGRALAIVVALHPELTAENIITEVVEEFLEQGLEDPEFLNTCGNAVRERIDRKRKRSGVERSGKAVKK